MKTIKETNRKYVLELFYRTTLRPGEDVVDNTDRKIAQELNITVNMVQDIVMDEMIKKENELKIRVNHE